MTDHAKRTKFSSRNMSALFRAPARGMEPASSSPGSRMLVLKAPVRRANAVAAPTPINTPSLRKENNGQDAHVSLVPTGRSGWHESPVKDAAQRVPAEPQAPCKQSENPWNDGRAAAAVLKRAPTVNKMEKNASGKWGDDAVEEDFEKREAQRQEKAKREFPSLAEAVHDSQLVHDDAHGGYPQQCGFGGGKGVYSQDARMYSEGYPRSNMDGNGHHNEAPHIAYDRSRMNGSGFNYGAHSDHHVRPPPSIEARGLHNHHSNQDVRFASPTTFDRPPVTHDRHYGPHQCHNDYHGDHAEYRRGFYEHEPHRYHESHEFYQGRWSRDEYEYVRRMDDHCARKESPAPEHPLMPVNNQSPQRYNAAAPSKTDRSSDPWRMTAADREGATKPTEAVQLQEPPSQPGLRRPTSAPEPSSVRILRRPGPRMLFDHKSGNMVHVEEITKDRRICSAKEARSGKVVLEFGHKRESVANSEVDTNLADPTVTEPAVDQEGLESTSQISTTDKECLVPQPVDEASTKLLKNRMLRARPMQNAPVSGRSFGRKVRAVVLKYRPVSKNGVKDCVASPAGKKKDKPRREKQNGVSSSPGFLSQWGGNKKAMETEVAAKHLNKRGDKQPHQLSRDQRGMWTSNDKGGVNSTASKEPERVHAVKSSSIIESLRKLPVGAGVVVVEGNSTLHGCESDDAQFQTVKSRKTLMLEKRKQRQVALASLGGFHRRGDVKAPGTRILLSSSSLRIGRVIVGVKKTGRPENPSGVNEKRPTPPPLARSFIDVIKPPSPKDSSEHVTVQPDVDGVTSLVELGNEGTTSQKKLDVENSQHLRTTRRVVGIASKAKKESSAINSKTTSLVKKTDYNESSGSRSSSSVEKKQTARGRVIKRVYVPKAVPDTQASKAEANTMDVAKESLPIQVQMSEAAPTQGQSAKFSKETTSKSRSRRPSRHGFTDTPAQSSTMKEPSVETNKSTTTRYEPKHKVSSTQPPNPVEKESEPAPSRPNRRLSKIKPVPPTKTSGTESSQKVYKKVYVVKAASTAVMASPSAA